MPFIIWYKKSKRYFNRFLEKTLPRGIYPRSLIIVIAPVVLLLFITTFTFIYRYFSNNNKQLSKILASEIALIANTYLKLRNNQEFAQVIMNKAHILDLNIKIESAEKFKLDHKTIYPIFFSLHQELSKTLQEMPFLITNMYESNKTKILIKIDDQQIITIIVDNKRLYNSNFYLFVMWLFIISIILLTVAIIFLHNQIKPIQHLAFAAENFGMGRDVPEFRPRGAMEIRKASEAFIKMRRRINRHVEQRTIMLAGVSHDLRTILTRFKLQLAIIDEDKITEVMRKDVNEMQAMLDEYMNFARGYGEEQTQATSINKTINEIKEENKYLNTNITIKLQENIIVKIKPKAFKRCISNLIINSAKFSQNITIEATIEKPYLIINIEDDGIGIAEEYREDVFRAFFQIDKARNKDKPGTGLGLAIARDIARNHGGDIQLFDSKLGGLKAKLHIPM